MKTPVITAICLTVLAGCSGNGKTDIEDIEEDGAVLQGPAAIGQRIVGEHAGVDYKQVKIISVESVDFSDSSLGCPQPDMAYLQVITPGHKIIAEVPGPEGSRQFDVRVAGSNGLICNKRGNQSQPRR